MFAFIHAGGQSAPLEAVSTEIPAAETCCARARFDDLRNRPWGNRKGAELGQGRWLTRLRLFGSQTRLNTGPDTIPAASNQAVIARTGQSSVRP
jgi:hypothetical protein